MSDAAAAIAAMHAQRVARARSGQGPTRKVVGYLGLDVPEELILAADMIPLRLEADLLAPTTAAARFGAGGHPVLRSVVAELLGGRYDFVDHLVIATMPRNLAALSVLIRELHDVDAQFARFEVHLLDILHSDSPGAVDFNLASMTRLAQQLESWSGRPLTDARLHAAIQLCNESRRLLEQYNRLRATGDHLDGVSALRLHGCATGGDREQFNARLHEWLHTDALRDNYTGPRVLYSGSATDTTAVYAAIEAQGLRIVDDDQDCGARAIGPLVDEQLPPITALAQAYAHRAPAPAGWHSEQRRDYLLQRIAACRPDGVVFHAAAYDHPPAWEYPLLRAAAANAGVRCTLLDPFAYRDMAALGACARAEGLQ